MKYLILLLALIPGPAFTETICKDYKITESDAFNWAEKDFNEAAARESLKALRYALDNNGSIGTCHLPNSVKILQGYILKQQAQAALSGDNVAEGIKNYHVLVFCKYLENTSPCE